MTIPDPPPSDLLLDNALVRAQKEKRRVSELLFEAYCERARIDCEPIPTEKGVYNEQWMLEKYDYRSPARVRRDLGGLDVAA